MRSTVVAWLASTAMEPSSRSSQLSVRATRAMSDPLDTPAAAVASEANTDGHAVEAGAEPASWARPLTWRDIRGTVRRRADELLSSEAEAAELEALRVATGETDGDMERHTMRQYLIAERIADTRAIPCDRELLLCACFLHDSGLYGPAGTGDVYIKDSARYARRTLEPFGCRTSGCGSVWTPVNSTTPSRRGGGWPRRSSSSAARTSWRCIPSSGGSAS